MDLRVRLLAAVDGGMSCRAAAARSGVAPSTAIGWHAPPRDAGDFAAKPLGGDMRSRRVEERASDILAVWEGRKDITLAQLRLALAEMGLAVPVAGIYRFFARRGMTRKKDWPSCRTRPARRPETAPGLFDGQLDLDPERLVFIDETWTATNMTRSHGLCPRGERLRMGFPHGHRKITTLVAGQRVTVMVAPMVLDWPINGDWFEAYMTQVLVPEIRSATSSSWTTS